MYLLVYTEGCAKDWEHWLSGEGELGWLGTDLGRTWHSAPPHIYQVGKHTNVLLSTNILTIKYRHHNYLISIHNLNDYWTKRKSNVFFCLNTYWNNIQWSKMQFWHFEKCVTDSSTRPEYVGIKSRKCFNIRIYFS